MLATIYYKKRLATNSKRIKLSTFLIKARIPKAEGAYYDGGKRYCVLGAIAKEADALIGTKTILWSMIYKHFNCTSEELDRHVHCPVEYCFHSNLVCSVLPHLNDEHHWSFKRMGKWLRKYNL